MVTHKPSSSMQQRSRQQGAVMVVSLVLLLVMTILALGASQSTRLQERMAGNQRDMEIALQSAEASLRAGDLLLATTDPNRCSAAGGSACDSYERNSLPVNMTRNDKDWWDLWGRDYTLAMGVKSTPEFVIEYVEKKPDTLSGGVMGIPNMTREFYRVTARSSGMSDSAQVVLQSTHARITY